MAIDFTRTFTTLGLIAGALNEVNTYRGTTVVDRRGDLITQFGTASVYGDLVSGLYDTVESAQSAEDGYVGALKTLAENVIISEVKADRPLVSATLPAAVKELRRQMLIASESLNDCPGTITVAAVGSPTGDHQFVFTRHEGFTGHVTDFLVPDVYLITCEEDRSTGGTQYQESFSIVGKPADSLPTDSTYPSGTGIDTTITAIDPATDGGIVTEGAFDGTWTGTGNNTPPSPWAIFGSAVAGTHVFRVSSDPRGGAGYALRLLGDGTVLHKVRQPITVEANGVYSVHFRVNKVADPGTDWAVSAHLTDAAGTAVTGNNSYTNVVASAACGSLNSSWVNPVTGVFLTPSVLPVGGCYLEIRFHQSGALTTAVANTAEVYVDHVSMQQHTEGQLYAGGPTFVCYSGVTAGVAGDTRTATVALSSGVPSTYLIRGIDRLVGLAALEDRIPTVTSGETQADALVT